MNNQHNTIGSKVADRDNGQPTAKWPIFDYSGNEVGVIEAEYYNANFNRATRECRWGGHFLSRLVVRRRQRGLVRRQGARDDAESPRRRKTVRQGDYGRSSG